MSNSSKTFSGTFERSTATTSAAVVDGQNYVVFEGLSDSDLTIDVDGTLTNLRVISGIQIVDRSEPGPPVLVESPADAGVLSGTSTTLSARFNSFPAATYQWYRGNAQLIPDATEETYTFNPVPEDDGETFYVTATNNLGSVSSAAATLSVVDAASAIAPSFTTQPVATQGEEGRSTTFTVAVAGNPAPQLQWYRNGVEISGETGTSLTFVPTLAQDGDLIRCTATNILGSVDSNEVQLTVIENQSVTIDWVTPTDANSIVFTGDSLALSVSASSVDGATTRVDFIDENGDLLAPDATDSSAPFEYSFTPPEGVTSTVIARAYDVAGNSGSTEPRTVEVQARPLGPEGIAWDFNGSLQGWSLGPGEGASHENNESILLFRANNGCWTSSPGIILAAGTTYKLEWTAEHRRTRQGGNSRDMFFVVATAIGKPGVETTVENFHFNAPPTPGTFEHTFTVPANGTYYMTFHGNWADSIIDDVSLAVVTTNSAPSVSWVSPTESVSLVLGQAVSLEASASDSDGTVARVDFVDENGDLIEVGATDSTSPYTYSWTPAATGSYTVIARAYDDEGDATSTASRSIVVSDTPSVAPVVSWVSPTGGASLALGDSITLEASASDSDGTVTRVDFVDENGDLIEVGATDSTSYTYTYSWTPGAAGSYTVVARAYDNDGLFADSAQQTIVVTEVSSGVNETWDFNGQPARLESWPRRRSIP